MSSPDVTPRYYDPADVIDTDPALGIVRLEDGSIAQLRRVDVKEGATEVRAVPFEAVLGHLGLEDSVL